MSYAVKLVTADPDHNTSMKRDDNVWDGEGWSSEFSEEFTLRSDSPDEKCMHSAGGLKKKLRSPLHSGIEFVVHNRDPQQMSSPPDPHASPCSLNTTTINNGPTRGAGTHYWSGKSNQPSTPTHSLGPRT